MSDVIYHGPNGGHIPFRNLIKLALVPPGYVPSAETLPDIYNRLFVCNPPLIRKKLAYVGHNLSDIIKTTNAKDLQEI